MIRAGSIVVGALLLSACSGPARPPVAHKSPAPVVTPVSKPAAKPETVAEAPKAETVQQPAVQQPPETPEPVQTARVEPAAVPAPEPAPVPAPPPPPTMRDVLNLDRGALADMLPSPRLKRQEAPAEVWQYVGQTCVLHVFFYPSAQDRRLSVDHLEATSPTGAKYPTNSCLAELVTARAQEP
jgi:hypothetical protein